MTTTAPARLPQPRVALGSRRFLVWSALAGGVLAALWSPELVDTVIAGGVGRLLLGDGDLVGAPIAGSVGAIALAFVTGVAGTFTACNVAVFAALGPAGSSNDAPIRAMLRPLGKLVVSAVVVSGAYGALAVLLGRGALQLSDARLGDPATGLPVRLLQAAIVFTLVGLVMVWRGLAVAGVVDDPVSGLLRRRPGLEMVLLGGMIGAFVIGRPYPPFRHLYEWAASTGDPALGAGLFALQSLGNVTLLVLLALVIALVRRRRPRQPTSAAHRRAVALSSGALVAAGVFFLVYWGVRTLARAGLVGWIPLPWS